MTAEDRATTGAIDADRATPVALNRTTPIAVVGTGTMGRGIAQVALAAGHQVRLYDAVAGRAKTAAEAIAVRIDRMVAKGRLPVDDYSSRLLPAASLAELADCGLVIEAIAEQLNIKQGLFAELEDIVAPECLLATNTSSLSVTEIAGALKHPGRFVGLHFFNPAPLLPLVEVVSGFATDDSAAGCAYETAKAWGKTPVRCADTPGFIVNRLARPFYAEAFRLYEERAADPATIDAVLRECGGFKMGPFELTDLIGQDVNEAVTRSVWKAFFRDPKFTPSLAQQRLVQSGRLGQKSGQGWFPYGEGVERPAPHTAEPCDAPKSVRLPGNVEGPLAQVVELIGAAGLQSRKVRLPLTPDDAIVLPGGTRLRLTDGLTATRSDGPTIHLDLALDYRTCTRVALAPGADADPQDVQAAIGLFQKLGKKVSVIADVPGMIVARTVAMLVDFALDAVSRGVAGREDIDTAMRLGVNYPRGPLDWGRELGESWVWEVLDHINDLYPGDRYAPSRALDHLSDIDWKQDER